MHQAPHGWRPRRIVAHLSLIAVCLALYCVGIIATIAELKPFVATDTTDRAKVAGIALGVDRPQYSIQSQLAFLYDCRIAINSMAGRLQPTPVRQKIARYCLEQSQQLTTSSPIFSAAWYTQALAASNLGDWALANTALRRSYQTGQNEQWLSELRIDLVEDNYEQVDQALLTNHRADIATLLADENGRADLVLRYVARATMAERIDDALDQVAAASRKRFEIMLARSLKRRQTR